MLQLSFYYQNLINTEFLGKCNDVKRRNPMNIVLAPDSFKGSLTAPQAAQSMKKAIKDLNENYEVIMKPMADGGEGTLETLLTAPNGKKIRSTCTCALGNSIQTCHAIKDETTAILEGATTAGLLQVPRHQRNPRHTTRLGIGEVMQDALTQGCTSFITGIGGCAT